MQQTENYSLNKPELSDYADITKISENMDVIDAQLKEAQNHREDEGIHVTAEQKTAWDAKETPAGAQAKADAARDAAIAASESKGSAAAVQGNLDAHKADTAVHLRQLSYTKSGTTHQLTGLSGVSGTVSAVFTATAGFAAGDTVTVDGTPYTIQLSNGEAAEDNLFVSGASVPVVVDTAGKKVNFKAGGGKKRLITEIITWSQDWIVPKGVKSINVRLFGGGGGGNSNSDAGGGGGGHMQYSTLSVTPGETIPITIASLADVGKNGNPSSFGSYLTASGGSAGGIRNGGNGGTGGGAGYIDWAGSNGNGGDASYGGGGGGGGGTEKSNSGKHGGKGGTYGGGGGAGSGGSETGGKGGTYGGDGGNSGQKGKAGTNTLSMDLDFVGEGLPGKLVGSSSNYPGSGGGGYGGNGGDSSNSDSYGGGGGGGYGGNGGKSGGGGGGYGGNGGNGRVNNDDGGGGGGGYGKNGNGGDAAKSGGIAAGGGCKGSGGPGICIITYFA